MVVERNTRVRGVSGRKGVRDDEMDCVVDKRNCANEVL